MSPIPVITAKQSNQLNNQCDFSMNIRCWGSRGSFPVCGPGFDRYGGDTTCVEVRSGSGDIVVIDAGTGIRNLGYQLGAMCEEPIHLIFTHAHLDHIMGFPFFLPIYNEKATLRIYGCPCSTGAFETVIKNIMRDPYFPVDFGALKANITFHNISETAFTIGSLSVTPITLNHPNGGCGLRIEENGRVFVFLTDNELGNDEPTSKPAEYFESFCRNADLLLHDAEYTEEEYPHFTAWGHSKFTDAVNLALSSGVKRMGLFHINSGRTDNQMDELVAHAQKLIYQSGSDMECFGVSSKFQISI
jgi:phosphoribosyl 1,2-cyclic phosphodiesterase